jgi:hypothetical protein
MADTRSETRKRFDAEFAAARKRGDKTFDFDGKSIAVKLANEPPQLSNKGMTMPLDASKPAPLRDIPKLSNEGLTVSRSMKSLGYDESGNPAPLRNIPKLPNKVEKEDLDEKGRLRNALMRASLDEGETPMKRGGKVKSSASSRGDGIAQRGHTKGRYI